MNLVDFNLFKLRSTVFLLQFPITFTLLIMNVWRKLLPEKVASAQGCTRAELEEMDLIKAKMHLFSKSAAKHIKTLYNYISEVKKEQRLKVNYQHIMLSPQFKQFKDVYFGSRGVVIQKNKVEDLIAHTYERVIDAYDETLDNTLLSIEKRQR
jgi:hypothetical protein